MSNRSSNKGSAIYFTYDDLPLKVYYRIIELKDYSLLCRSGKPNDLDRRWEEIVKKVEKFNNSLWYHNHLDDLKELKWIMSEYIIVKSSLYKLLYKFDKELVQELIEKGYYISTASDEEYAQTLFDRLQNIENLITKLKMKKNEMALEQEVEEEKKTKPSFDLAMAQLSMTLGFVLPEDITLARFNEYNRMLQEKNSKKILKEEDNG